MARALAAAVVLAAGAAARADGASSGGLIAALEAASIVVVAEVSAVDPLAHGGHVAALAVERVLVPPDGEAPATLSVAWEEPAPSLPPRLAPGRRILAAAGPLPTASIWRSRVPDDAARAELLGLAGGGAGYLVRPSAAELDVLEHYLLVDAAARRGDAGALHLARLAAIGQPPLAEDAVRRLAGFDALDAHLSPGAGAALVDALLRTDAPELPPALLTLIAERRPEALREPLAARISLSGASAPPILHAARGALDGGLDDEVAVALLESDSPVAREAAARHASGPRARGRLRALARRDPAPEVRAAAITRLVELERMAALRDATDAFDDGSAPVRLAAVQAAASLDPESVGPLHDLAVQGSDQEARMAVAALSLMGEDAHLVLAELAAEHPDPAIRTLSGIAVGQPIGDRH